MNLSVINITVTFFSDAWKEVKFLSICKPTRIFSFLKFFICWYVRRLKEPEGRNVKLKLEQLVVCFIFHRFTLIWIYIYTYIWQFILFFLAVWWPLLLSVHCIIWIEIQFLINYVGDVLNSVYVFEFGNKIVSCRIRS